MKKRKKKREKAGRNRTRRKNSVTRARPGWCEVLSSRDVARDGRPGWEPPPPLSGGTARRPAAMVRPGARSEGATSLATVRRPGKVAVVLATASTPAGAAASPATARPRSVATTAIATTHAAQEAVDAARRAARAAIRRAAPPPGAVAHVPTRDSAPPRAWSPEERRQGVQMLFNAGRQLYIHH